VIGKYWFLEHSGEEASLSALSSPLGGGAGEVFAEFVAVVGDGASAPSWDEKQQARIREDFWCELSGVP